MNSSVLKHFILLVEQENFSKAAEMLYISQPTLSRQILELEKAVGTPLLNRTTRRVSVTLAGREFYQYAKKALSEWDSCVRRLQQITSSEVSELSIGYSITPQVALIMGGIRQEAWRHTKIDVKLKKLPENLIFKALHSGLLDCAVMNKPLDDDLHGLESIKISDGGISAIMSENNPLAAHKCIEIRQLNGYPLVLTPIDAYPRYYNEIFNKYLTSGCEKPKLIIVDEPEEVPAILSHPGYISIWPSVFPVWKGLGSVKITDCLQQMDFIMLFSPLRVSPYYQMLADCICSQIRDSQEPVVGF